MARSQPVISAGSSNVSNRRSRSDVLAAGAGAVAVCACIGPTPNSAPSRTDVVRGLRIEHSGFVRRIMHPPPRCEKIISGNLKTLPSGCRMMEWGLAAPPHHPLPLLAGRPVLDGLL